MGGNENGANTAAGTEPPSENNTHLEISRINTKVPPFWKNNPTLWFCQLESQFLTNGISAEKTRYHFIVGSIESEILSQVSDIIINPPQEKPYSTLKQRLLERYADSEEKRLKKLLKDMDLGDRRPSHLLREMRELAGTKVNENLLKSLWFQLLPQQTQAILSLSDDDLSKLALLADKISEVTDNPQVCSIKKQQTVNKETDRISNLELQISELTKTINSLKFQRPARSQSRSKQGQRTRSASRTSEICWYHAKFHSKASKCKQPCKFSSAENK